MKVLVFKDIKHNRWTLWSLDRKEHYGYKKQLSLKKCQFIVIQSSRKKVKKSKKRFPHAWIIGEISSSLKGNKFVTYNPFKDLGFKCNNKIIKSSKKAQLTKDGKVLI